MSTENSLLLLGGSLYDMPKVVVFLAPGGAIVEALTGALTNHTVYAILPLKEEVFPHQPLLVPPSPGLHLSGRAGLVTVIIAGGRGLEALGALRRWTGLIKQAADALPNLHCVRLLHIDFSAHRLRVVVPGTASTRVRRLDLVGVTLESPLILAKLLLQFKALVYIWTDRISFTLERKAIYNGPLLPQTIRTLVIRCPAIWRAFFDRACLSGPPLRTLALTRVYGADLSYVLGIAKASRTSLVELGLAVFPYIKRDTLDPLQLPKFQELCSVSLGVFMRTSTGVGIVAGIYSSLPDSCQNAHFTFDAEEALTRRETVCCIREMKAWEELANVAKRRRIELFLSISPLSPLPIETLMHKCILNSGL